MQFQERVVHDFECPFKGNANILMSESNVNDCSSGLFPIDNVVV